jgi:hypothetical protein
METHQLQKHVVVAVLGDVGRSPRMQYHANSFAGFENVGRVTLLGYEGEECMSIVSENPVISHKRFVLREFSAIKKFSSVIFARKLIAMLL